MDPEAFAEIVKQESLLRWLECAPPSGGSSNKVCVFPIENGWATVMTDERAVPLDDTYRFFRTEPSALADALDALRAQKSLMT